jgi:hypothetical protein
LSASRRNHGRVERRGWLRLLSRAIEGIERIPPYYDLGFGILGLRAEEERPIDLDGGGEPDSFTVCDGIHGVNHKVWQAAPREGEPLWHAYYNLGYEIEGPSECASEP